MSVLDRPLAANTDIDTVPYRATLSGFCAILIGLGLGRFAYTPLIPALIASGGLSPRQAAWLGAINLAGYLAGALTGRHLAARWTVRATLRFAMAACALSLAACAVDGGFVWLAGWRFLAGLTGATLMVLAGPTVLTVTPAGQRGRVSGIIYAGVGLGIALSGTAVPVLVNAGLPTTWLVLGGLAALLAAVGWTGWPELAGQSATSGRVTGGGPMAPGTRLALALVAVAYGAEAAGFVPHTLFWVDFLARELGMGLATGGVYWTLFGAGAAVGAFAAGTMAERFGFRRTLTGALAVKALAVGLPVLTAHPLALGLSSVIVGALVPGMVVLAAGRVAELTGPATQARIWSRMTLVFALAQAVAAQAMTALVGATGTYVPLYAIGAGVLLIGALCAGAGRGAR
jgi:predicted MFS family arabinose efflux permease